ncbi:MAG: AAA family ATPase [Acidobacteriota bacterium]|nr:AAA family ATPase [Acidobacteriota bacterium]
MERDIKISDFRLIGLTGTNGAGKGEVAAFYQKKGYSCISLSDVIREELESRSLPPSRENLIACGNELREKFGADILAHRAAARISGPAVIDSIRHPAEIEYLRSLGSFILIAVDAPVEMRFNRVKKRGRDESASSLEEFIQQENREKASGGNNQQLDRCFALADLIIINDGSLAELHQKLEKLG